MAVDMGPASSRDRLCLALRPTPSGAASASSLCLPLSGAAASVGSALPALELLLFTSSDACFLPLCLSSPLRCCCQCLLSPPPFTGPHAPQQPPSTPPHMPQPQTKAQACTGQGSSRLPSTPSWSSLLLTLSSSSRQTTWGHRRGEARELRAGQAKSLAKEALGRVAGGRPVVSCL